MDVWYFRSISFFGKRDEILGDLLEKRLVLSDFFWEMKGKKTRRRIRVAIGDDHCLFREMLVTILSRDRTIEVVGEAADGDEVVQLAERVQPDILLLDLVMPKRGGYSMLLEIGKRSPATRVIILTGYADLAFDQHALDAARGGAWGYLVKGVSSATLLTAIKRVFEGEMWVDKEQLSPAAVDEFMRSWLRLMHSVGEGKKFTSSEERILRLVAEGMSNDAIACQLHLSPKTVKVHLGHIFRKLGMRNRVQVALWVLENLVRPGKQ